MRLYTPQLKLDMIHASLKRQLRHTICTHPEHIYIEVDIDCLGVHCSLCGHRVLQLLTRPSNTWRLDHLITQLDELHLLAIIKQYIPDSLE